MLELLCNEFDKTQQKYAKLVFLEIQATIFELYCPEWLHYFEDINHYIVFLAEACAFVL